MKGVDYLVDESGTRKAVVIDLTEKGELWEDFCDAAIAEERRDEAREPLDEVRARLARSDDE